MHFKKTEMVIAKTTNRDFLRAVLYAKCLLWKTYKFRSCHRGSGHYETIIIDSTAANLYLKLQLLIAGMEADGDSPSSDVVVTKWIRKSHTEALVLLGIRFS